MIRQSKCRYCGGAIIWARTERNGKMPVDAEPYVGDEPGGLFVFRDAGSPEGPLVLGVTPAAFPDEHYYRRHICDASTEWRR